MYRVSGGQWTVADGQTFTLPAYGGAAVASAPIITVGDLHLPPIVR
jgi:hypothetical protein